MTEATRMEAIHRLGGELPFTVHAAEPKDDRRNKDYHRDVTVALKVAFENNQERDRIPHPAAVRAIARELLKKRGIHFHTDPDIATGACGAKLTRFIAHDSYLQWSPAMLHWSVRFAAKRPSEIPAESTVVAWVREHVVPALATAFRRAAEHKREHERRKEAVKQANHIGSWAANLVLDRAKKATRYDQRLAALQAEMDAEIAVQAEQMREDRVIEDAVANAEERGAPEPEALAYAVEHFDKRLVGWSTPFRTSPEWRESDLFPDLFPVEEGAEQ